MQSLNTELVKNMVEGFRRVGFYIFSKEVHQDVIKIIRELNLQHTLRIKILNSEKGMFLIDVDTRTYDMECHDKCLIGEILDRRCYAECKEEIRLNIIEQVISKLNELLTRNGGR